MRASYVLDNLLAAPYKLWFFFSFKRKVAAVHHHDDDGLYPIVHL